MWKDPFKRPLLEHPDLSLNDLDFTLQGCDACHMGGRKSSKSAFVSGNRYNPVTYEVRMWLCYVMNGKIEGTPQPILDSESSSSNSENEDDGSDREGRVRSYEFNLGRFCAERTRVFHKFNHWEVSDDCASSMTRRSLLASTIYFTASLMRLMRSINLKAEASSVWHSQVVVLRQPTRAATRTGSWTGSINVE